MTRPEGSVVVLGAAGLAGEAAGAAALAGVAAAGAALTASTLAGAAAALAGVAAAAGALAAMEFKMSEGRPASSPSCVCFVDQRGDDDGGGGRGWG